MNSSNSWVRNAVKAGCAGLVASSVFWIGCETTDQAAFHGAAAQFHYNQAAIDASQGNYRSATQNNAWGSYNSLMSGLVR